MLPRSVSKYNLGQHSQKEDLSINGSLASIRMGTTVATNALLERKGAKSALLTTKGFNELLQIGHQTRANLFELDIKKPDVLYEKCVEVDERVTVEHAYAEDGHIGKTVKGLSGDMMRILKELGMCRLIFWPSTGVTCN